MSETQEESTASDFDHHESMEQELEMRKLALTIENQDKREDAQRRMAWFALGGMLLYPFAVVLAFGLGLDGAAKILGDMAATYFVSVAAIVAAFYGKEAVVSRNSVGGVVGKGSNVERESLPPPSPGRRKGK